MVNLAGVDLAENGAPRKFHVPFSVHSDVFAGCWVGSVDDAKSVFSARRGGQREFSGCFVRVAVIAGAGSYVI
jgi:hypothetical protein